MLGFKQCFALYGVRPATVALWVLALAACGGGGGGGSSSSSSATTLATVTAPAGPTLSVALQGIKSLHFSWPDVADETLYRLLENPDGASGYSPVAALAANTTSHDLGVFLPARVNARYILQACNAVGCTDSLPVAVGGTLAGAAGYFKASNTEAGDAFGVSVALSGDGSTLAVAAMGESSSATGINFDQTNNAAKSSGAVYVFSKSGAGWSQQAYVKASNTNAGDAFGSSVALSNDGSTLAVGAYHESSHATGVDDDQADNSALNSGAVYVFTRSGATWTQQAYVKASNTKAEDGFGLSLALSGDGTTLAVGAAGEDSNATGIGGDQSNSAASNSGAVYLFTRSAGTWSQQAYIKASNAEANDWFGYRVALSGDGTTLAVGAHFEDSGATGIGGDQANNSTSASGAVYVFAKSAGGWSQQAYVKASNTKAGDEFGSSVALSGDGNTLAVGAPDEGSRATGINGDQNDHSSTYSGAAYVFTRSAGVWSQQAYVKASNTRAGAWFGWSVALSGDGRTLAVAATYESSKATGVNGDQSDTSTRNSGAVYVFARSAGGWSQQAYVKASNTGADDGFGTSLGLSVDGSALAVGAYRESSRATGIGGNQADNTAVDSGAVYLY